MIKITQEIDLHEFNTWGGATSTVKYLTQSDLEVVQEYLEGCYPNGMTETELNDFLWFETDLIAELLGYEDFDEIMSR